MCRPCIWVHLYNSEYLEKFLNRGCLTFLLGNKTKLVFQMFSREKILLLYSGKYGMYVCIYRYVCMCVCVCMYVCMYI